MISRILVALDESERASTVLAAAAELAEQFNAELLLFRAVDVPPEIPAAGAGVLPDELTTHLIQVARDALIHSLLPYPHLKSRTLVRLGPSAPRAILEVSIEQDVDLIAIGSHGYGGLDRLLGTTAGTVANLADRNVLVVHEGARARRSPLDSP